jgi:adenylate cyclase
MAAVHSQVGARRRGIGWLHLLLSFQRKSTVAENEEVWRKIFSEGNAMFDRGRALFGMLPSDPRCMFCHGPFRGPGGRVMTVIGRGQSREDPRICNACIQHGQKHPGGTHVDLATVFADMRGSTPTAERIGDRAFQELINRFFLTSSKVLIDHGALLGRLAGDQAIGYFVPGIAGPRYAQAALDSAIELLVATGHADEEGPWIPLGVGVHAGNAFVGLLGEDGRATELTALGDDINTSARLADAAGEGEILASNQLIEEIGLDTQGLEHRTLELKGKSTPLEVAVITPT